MVLPYNLIIPISLVSTIGYAIAHFVIPAGDFRIEGLRIDHTIVPVTMLLLFEGILLRQLRLEFDARLTEMRRSVVEIERAKHQADIARQQAEADRRRAEDADRAKRSLPNISHDCARRSTRSSATTKRCSPAWLAASPTGTAVERIQYNARRLLSLINDV